MRLPVDTNAGLKKCLFCSNFRNGVCEAMPVEVTDNRYELVEGIVQEALKEGVDIPNTVFKAISDLVPKRYHSRLFEVLENCEPDILSDVADVIIGVLERRLEIKASISPDTEFCCKNWR